MTPLQRLQDELTAWTTVTFPGQSVEQMIEHLAREVAELRAKPHDHMEMADCLLLLLDIAHSQKVSACALVECGFTKLEICKGRKWGAPDKDGVREHVRKEAA